jgi:anti-sigma28 factor (negative regulator of flagellin synthesis)
MHLNGVNAMESRRPVSLIHLLRRSAQEYQQRELRIDALRQAIATGKYAVPGAALAQAIVRSTYG